MLSPGEMLVLLGAAVFFLGRKEGVRMVQQGGRTLGKFWKEMAADSTKPARKGRAAATTTKKGDAPEAPGGRADKD